MQSWQDLQRRQARGGAAAAPANAAPNAAPKAAAGAPAPAAAAASPRLQQLMAERQQLEARMQGLVGDGGGDAALAARYPVASAAQRRLEAQRWASSQDAVQQRLLAARRAQNRATTPALPERGRSTAPAEPGTPSQTRAWSQARDALLGADRRLAQAESALARTDALDAPLNGALERANARPAERARARDAVQRMGSELRDQVQGPKRKVEQGLQKAREVLDAGEKIARDWDRRRDAIAGPDLQRVARGYDARTERLLNVVTGSLAQLTERSDALRSALQQRKAAGREEAQQDEDRRERALQKRQQRRDEERGNA